MDEVGERAVVRLIKIKRPGGRFWFDLEPVLEDDHGTWLYGRPGARWAAPQDGGTLSMAGVVLLAAGRPWVAWWVDDPADRRLEIDVCLPPEPVDRGWRYVDLELDPVRHEPGGRVEIEDWDEYDEALREGWMSAADGRLARSTAEALAAVLRSGDQPWLDRGWHLLAAGGELPRTP
jgi:hypothetical protein